VDVSERALGLLPAVIRIVRSSVVITLSCWMSVRGARVSSVVGESGKRGFRPRAGAPAHVEHTAPGERQERE
jgi:hypothetical protein